MSETRQEREDVLLCELHRAETALKLTRFHFDQVIADIPSGLPAPDGAARISNARTEYTHARKRYAAALDAFNDFVLGARARAAAGRHRPAE